MRSLVNIVPMLMIALLHLGTAAATWGKDHHGWWWRRHHGHKRHHKHQHKKHQKKQPLKPQDTYETFHVQLYVADPTTSPNSVSPSGSCGESYYFLRAETAPVYNAAGKVTHRRATRAQLTVSMDDYCFDEDEFIFPYGCDEIELQYDAIEIAPDASSVSIKALDFTLEACTGKAYSVAAALQFPGGRVRPFKRPFKKKFDCTQPYDQHNAQGTPLRLAQSPTCKVTRNQLSGKRVEMRDLQLSCNPGKAIELIDQAQTSPFYKRPFAIQGQSCLSGVRKSTASCPAGAAESAYEGVAEGDYEEVGMINGEPALVVNHCGAFAPTWTTGRRAPPGTGGVGTTAGTPEDTQALCDSIAGAGGCCEYIDSGNGLPCPPA